LKDEDEVEWKIGLFLLKKERLSRHEKEGKKNVATHTTRV